ncbi:MAG: class I SAM-dependent methyltransferase [Planctomycetota bacterium]
MNPPPRKKVPRRPRAPRKARRTFTAATADRHELYELSVQSPVEDVRFLARVYEKARGKRARHFREDFCGTGLLSARWIKRGPEYTAEGFDISPETIGWGLEHNFAPLGKDAKRATLHVKDVRAPSRRRPDVRCAQNFSYFVFKARSELLGYLRAAHADLARDGVLVLDIYGGPESMEEMVEERPIEEGFTYVWDQDRYWPGTGEYRAYIHFRFKDGTKLERAFRYDWRLWALPEVKDALLEAGFAAVDTYWEGTDEDGESGNGIYRKSRRGENCLAWVTYLVAYK